MNKKAFINNNKFGHCGCGCGNCGSNLGAVMPKLRKRRSRIHLGDASALDSDPSGDVYDDSNSDYMDNSADFIADPSIGYEVNADYTDTSADFGVNQNTSDNPNAALTDTTTGAIAVSEPAPSNVASLSTETVPTGNAAPSSMESGSSMDQAPATDTNTQNAQISVQTKGLSKPVLVGAAVVAAFLILK